MGLHYASREQVAQLDVFTARLGPMYSGGGGDAGSLSAPAMLAGLSKRLAQSGAEGQAAREEFDRLAASLAAELAEPPQHRSVWPAEDSFAQLAQLDSRHLLSSDGRLGFLLLRIKQSEGRFDGGTQAIDELRRLIAATQARHPEVKLGLTGMPVLENDEMRTSQDDMLRATLLSLVGVAALFVAGFGGLRHPLMTVAALLLAMAWSFGYVTLLIGHLNILSVSFGVILIGLGIDFGIHYVARYLQLRQTIDHAGDALVKTASSVGPGVVTGGLTTALAFCTCAMTRFTGIAELGVIAGGGILLCILAAILVLPAMIMLSDARRAGAKYPSPLPLDLVLNPLLKRPWHVLAGGLVVIAVVGAGAINLRYDHNLLNLQPKGIESVRVEEKLLAHSDRSVWFALSMADSPQELRERKAQFEQLPTVDRIEEIVSLLPAEDAEKSAAIERIAGRLAALPEAPPQPAAPDARQTMLALAALNQPAAEGASPAAAAPLLAEIGARVQALGPEAAAARLAAWQQRTTAELWQRLSALREIASAEPPVLADVPPSLSTRFVGKHGRYLMKVYARGAVWDMDALARFVGDVSRIDPEITGHPVQTYHASRQMQTSYIHAAIYSLLALLIVLMVDFRSVRYSLLAVAPMLLGLLLMFGLMGLFDIPLNPANMIVLPLILGIGIDDGVHVVHDFRRQEGPYRLSGSTATAVLITSATTVAGFGSMMIVAQHQGLRSLGQVLTIGVLCCLATSLLPLPAALALLSRRRQTAEQAAQPATTLEPASTPESAPPPLTALRRARSEPAEAATSPLAETPRRRAG
jgi:hopanoid biosynthesis associated RND transporter like protein HpnN